MMMKKIMLGMLSICLLTTACKKDDAAPDYANLLVGKWTYVNQTSAITAPNGSISRDTLIYQGGSYCEFKTNKKYSLLIKTTSGIKQDSGTYNLVGNQLYATNYSGISDTNSIQNITPTTLTIYWKRSILPGYNGEVWNNLKK